MTSPSLRRHGPPGALFYVATTGAIILALDADSRSSFGTFLIAAPMWLIVAGLWLVRFVMATNGPGPWLPIGQRARWVVIPAAMGLVFLITRTDAPFDARLAFSRDAMDQMAADVTAGGTTDRGWVGLYDVGHVERTANGLRFVVDDSWLQRHGFAYAPSGEPTLTDENYSPLWAGPTFRSVGDGWWFWSEAWD